MEEPAQPGRPHNLRQYLTISLSINRYILVGTFGGSRGGCCQSKFSGILSHFVGRGWDYHRYYGDGITIQGIRQSVSGQLQFFPIDPHYFFNRDYFICGGIPYSPTTDDPGRGWSGDTGRRHKVFSGVFPGLRVFVYVFHFSIVDEGNWKCMVAHVYRTIHGISQFGTGSVVHFRIWSDSSLWSVGSCLGQCDHPESFSRDRFVDLIQRKKGYSHQFAGHETGPCIYPTSIENWSTRQYGSKYQGRWSHCDGYAGHQFWK